MCKIFNFVKFGKTGSAKISSKWLECEMKNKFKHTRDWEEDLWENCNFWIASQAWKFIIQRKLENGFLMSGLNTILFQNMTRPNKPLPWLPFWERLASQLVFLCQMKNHKFSHPPRAINAARGLRQIFHFFHISKINALPCLKVKELKTLEKRDENFIGKTNFPLLTQQQIQLGEIKIFFYFFIWFTHKQVERKVGKNRFSRAKRKSAEKSWQPSTKASGGWEVVLWAEELMN